MAATEERCTSRMPLVGDRVCTPDEKHQCSDAAGNKDAWLLHPGEIATVAMVDKDGDFKLRNPSGLESTLQFRDKYIYKQKDAVENPKSMAAGSCITEPSTDGFPYIVRTKKNADGVMTSMHFTFSEPQKVEEVEEVVVSKGKGKGKGKGPGGKGPPGGGLLNSLNPTGARPPRASQNNPKGTWYTIDGNFRIEIVEEVFHYIDGDTDLELVAKDGVSDEWVVVQPASAPSDFCPCVGLKHTKENGLPVLLRMDSKQVETVARKTGNVCITMVSGDALVIKNHGMSTGDEATYSVAGQPAPFASGIGIDNSVFFVRSLPGIPSGRLELYDTKADAESERKMLDPPSLKLSGLEGSDAQHVTVLCTNHGYTNGDRVLLSGIVDKSKLDSKPWDELNAEFIVSDADNDTFKLKVVTGGKYFDAAKCLDKAFDGISGKVCSVNGRQELDHALEPGAYGQLIAKNRKFGGAAGMSQLLGSVEAVLEQKNNKESVEQDDVDMSVDESAACEKRQCPRCELFFRVDMFDSHWESHSSEVLYNIFLGGNRNAWNDIELTKRTGITNILNVASGDCASDELLRYFHIEKQLTFKTYLAMPLKDNVDFDILGQLDEAVQFIKASLEENEQNHILVHCAQGISRSSAAVIAYLMGEPNRMSLRGAYELCKKQRNVCRPNPAFIEQLGKHEMTLFKHLTEPTLKTLDVWPAGENYINLDNMDISCLASG